MQKTEKQCKNQCFCYHKTTKISPKTGPKTQKSASGPGHLRNRKKRCCKPKNWGQQVEKHGVFSLFACRFWTGAFTNRCLPYCFLQCFLKASVTTYQKQEVLAEKCPPPPGKPVTFYECHPDDHAPAPSVRADLLICIYIGTYYLHICIYIYMVPPQAKKPKKTKKPKKPIFWVSCLTSSISKTSGKFFFLFFLVFSKFFWFCIFLLPIVFFKYLFCNFSSPRHLENFIWDASFDLAVTSFVQNVLMKPFKRQFTTAHLLWKLWRPRSHVLWLRQSQRRARTWRWHRVAGTWSLRTICGSALENLYMVKPASLTSLALTKPSSAHCTHDVSFPSTSISRA